MEYKGDSFYVQAKFSSSSTPSPASLTNSSASKSLLTFAGRDTFTKAKGHLSSSYGLRKHSGSETSVRNNHFAVVSSKGRLQGLEWWNSKHQIPLLKRHASLHIDLLVYVCIFLPKRPSNALHCASLPRRSSPVYWTGNWSSMPANRPHASATKHKKTRWGKLCGS